MTSPGNISGSDTFDPRHGRRSAQLEEVEEEEKRATMGIMGASLHCRGFHRNTVGRPHRYLEATAALGPIISSFKLL